MPQPKSRPAIWGASVSEGPHRIHEEQHTLTPAYCTPEDPAWLTVVGEAFALEAALVEAGFTAVAVAFAVDEGLAVLAALVDAGFVDAT